MTVREKLEQYPLLDVAVLHHGFAPYLRDYELLIEAGWVGDLGGRYHYLFTHCVLAECVTRLRDEVWLRSWDDLFTNYARWQQAGAPEGFLWGTNWALTYPGWEYVKNSPRARTWSERLGREMHEVTVETNAYLLRLLFHNVRIRKVSKNTNLIKEVVTPLEE